MMDFVKTAIAGYFLLTHHIEFHNYTDAPKNPFIYGKNQKI